MSPKSQVTRASARRLLALVTVPVALALGVLPAAAGAAPRTASPLAWDGEPGYGYLVRPTDQLGVPGVEAGGAVMPDGAVFTPSVEVVPWIGGKTVGVPARRGLPDPKVPLFATGASEDPEGATAAWWASEVGGVPSAVMALAPGRGREVGIALRWGGPKTPGARLPAYRYARPAAPLRTGLYTQPGEPFEAGRCWKLTRVGSAYAVVRGDSVVALLTGTAKRTSAPLPGVRITKCARDAAAFAAALRVRLPKTGAKVHVVVPFVPLPVGDARVAAVANANAAAAGAAMARAFRAQRAGGATISLPEPEVQQALDAAVATMLVPRYRLPDGQWVQTVNTMQYHSFWLRDAAVISNAADLLGLHTIARENLDFYRTWQTPDGEFSSRPGQRDGHGQALWSLGQHVRLTGDTAFASAWVGAVTRAIDWTERTMATNPLGILPPGDPKDNEFVAGEITGDQFWGVAGLDAAASLAATAGEPTLQQRALALRDTLQARVVALARATATSRGIRPALDQTRGFSWGELWAAWPYPVFAPTDPLVQTTMAASVADQAEGIATYGDREFLHGYTGFRVWQTQLRAGDQVQPVQGLYSTLAHMTATGGGFETYLRPYRGRDARSNIAPHGWHAAELTTLVHDLLARDQDDGIVLLGALPPSWLKPGAETDVRRLVTAQGEVDLRFTATRTGGRLDFAFRDRDGQGTTPLRWPLPASVEGATVSGQGRLEGRTVALTGPAGRVDVRWTRKAGGPTLKATIAKLQREYRVKKRTPPR